MGTNLSGGASVGGGGISNIGLKVYRVKNENTPPGILPVRLNSVDAFLVTHDEFTMTRDCFWTNVVLFRPRR
jgi:hypothetical protein